MLVLYMLTMGTPAASTMLSVATDPPPVYRLFGCHSLCKDGGGGGGAGGKEVSAILFTIMFI